MNHDRPAQLARQLDLRPEDRLLHVARREVVVIIEANLADGPGRRRARDLCSHDLGRALGTVGNLVRLVRMDADGHAHVGPELVDASRSRRLAGVAARQDDKRAIDAGLARTRDDGVKIGAEDLVS